MSIDINSIAILNGHGADYFCFIVEISKNNLINKRIFIKNKTFNIFLIMNMNNENAYYEQNKKISTKPLSLKIT